MSFTILNFLVSFIWQQFFLVFLQRLLRQQVYTKYYLPLLNSYKNVLISGQIIFRAVHSWVTIVSVSARAEIVVVLLAGRQSVCVRACVSVRLTSLMCLVAGSTMLARYLTLFLLSLLLLCILPGTFLFHVLLCYFDARVLCFYILFVD